MTKAIQPKHKAPSKSVEVDADGKPRGVYATNPQDVRVFIPIRTFERSGLKPGFKFATAPGIKARQTDEGWEA